MRYVAEWSICFDAYVCVVLDMCGSRAGYDYHDSLQCEEKVATSGTGYVPQTARSHWVELISSAGAASTV